MPGQGVENEFKEDGPGGWVGAIQEKQRRDQGTNAASSGGNVRAGDWIKGLMQIWGVGEGNQT